MILKDKCAINFKATIKFNDIDYTLVCEKKRVGDTLEISSHLEIQIPIGFQSFYILKFISFQYEVGGRGVVKVFPLDDHDDIYDIKIAKFNIAQLISIFIPIGG